MSLIEINLLPLERQKKKRKFSGLPSVKTFLPLAVGIVVALVVIHILLSGAVFLNKISYKSLSKKWEKLAPRSNESNQLRQEASRINNKIKLVEQLLTERFSWSRKLQSLNECIVPGIWLDNFALGEKTDSSTGTKRVFLSLSGSAIASGGQGTVTIGKFMKNLKEKDNFFDDFDEIELGSIQRKNIKETEIMDFTITAYFKKERVIF